MRAENTFLLALDGDVDFQPDAILKLVDLMKRNPDVGAACGRIHPIGSGKGNPGQLFYVKICSCFLLIHMISIIKDIYNGIKSLSML